MKYPIGIQSFEKIRQDGYAYVDKTALMFQLTDSGSYYFLSRPRRFGKSLFLSTLAAYFEGRKELFEGLAVSRLEREWRTYPILHLDLNSREYKDIASLDAELNRHLEGWEKLYGDTYKDRALEERFLHVINNAYEKTGSRVVILVDEYDKPLLQAIGNDPLQSAYRSRLKAFYSVVKTLDARIRFAFFMGVTKFGKVSVFSDLNNLFDLSFDNRYIELCGISEQELHNNFDEGVAELAQANGMEKQECYERLKRDFDGYHFCLPSKGLYNPFSVLSTLASGQFRDYWFETGTPSFLVYQLKRTCYPLENMTTEELSTDTLNSIDIMDQNPLPLLYQSGYLTLKSYNQRYDSYLLGFPNREVEQGFVKYLLPFYTPKVQDKSKFAITQFVKDIEHGDVESFMQRFEAFFATGDYEVVGKAEKYFQNTVYVFFRLLGLYVDVERHTANGRMDIVIQTPKYIYILELKIDKNAQEALQQIEDKGYANYYATDARHLFKIGMNFSTETKLIDDWKIVE
jgi:hypothetical protein